MANRPSIPEIISVNSEELEALVRNLLPSQNGFGSELQASNVITPIIDLTSTAEGSTLGNDLQTALAYGSQTAFEASNSTATLANSPGWYRVVGTSTGWFASATGFSTNEFIMTDGATPKRVWAHNIYGNSSSYATGSLNIDLVFGLAAGITLQAKTDSVSFFLEGSIRQIADSDGNLVNPVGLPV